MRTAVVDEGVPHDLLEVLRTRDLDVLPFPKDWRGLPDRELLLRVDAMQISVLVTCDKNMAFQQNLKSRSFGLVVLPTTTLADLKPLAAAIVASLHQAEPGRVTWLDRAGRLTSSAL